MIRAVMAAPMASHLAETAVRIPLATRAATVVLMVGHPGNAVMVSQETESTAPPNVPRRNSSAPEGTGKPLAGWSAHEAVGTVGPNRHGSGRSWYANTTAHGEHRGREAHAESDENADASRTHNG